MPGWTMGLRWGRWTLCDPHVMLAPRDVLVGVYVAERDPVAEGWCRAIVVHLPFVVFSIDVRTAER